MIESVFLGLMLSTVYLARVIRAQAYRFEDIRAYRIVEERLDE